MKPLLRRSRRSVDKSWSKVECLSFFSLPFKVAEYRIKVTVLLLRKFKSNCAQRDLHLLLWRFLKLFSLVVVSEESDVHVDGM